MSITLVNFLKIVGRPYAGQLLEELSFEPKRFKDLEVLVPVKTTLSKRLKELEEAGMLESTIIKGRNKRSYKGYKVTEKTIKVFQCLNEQL